MGDALGEHHMDPKKINIALRIACALCDPNSKTAQFGTRSERFKLAQLIIKKAIDASSFSAIGPLVAQQFVCGALGEYTARQIQGSEKAKAIRSLVLSRLGFSKADAAKALKGFEDAATETLTMIHRTKAGSWGLEALEEAYTKLVTEGSMFKAGESSGVGTLNKMKDNLQKLLTTVVTNAMTDSFRKSKRRREIGEDLGREVDEHVMEMDDEDFDPDVDPESHGFMSGRPSASMQAALIELVEGGNATRVLASQAINVLKINSLAAARVFINAADECDVIPSGGKFSTDLRRDVLALAIGLPFVNSRLDMGDRMRTIQAVFEYIKADESSNKDRLETAIFGPSPVTKTLVETHLARVGLKAKSAESVAEYITKTSPESIAASVANWLDSVYIELVRLMVRVDMNIDSGKGVACTKSLAAISDKKFLKGIERQLGVPRSTSLFRGDR